MLFCLYREIKGTVLPFPEVYFYNYFSNYATAGLKPGMKKEEVKTQKFFKLD